MATQKNETRTDRPGFVPGVAHLAIDVVDRGQATAVALLQDARTELRVTLDHGIELGEKAAASLFRFARKVTERVDEGLTETLASAERLLGTAVKSARATTRAATELASTAASGVGGTSAAA